jgi:hypothetical protein
MSVILAVAYPSNAATTPVLDLKPGQVQASFGYVPPYFQFGGAADVGILDRLGVGAAAQYYGFVNNEETLGALRATYTLTDGAVSWGISLAAGVSQGVAYGRFALDSDAVWVQPSICLSWPVSASSARPWMIFRASLGPSWRYVYRQLAHTVMEDGTTAQPTTPGWSAIAWIPNAELAFPFYGWTWAGSRESLLEAVVGGGSLLSIRGKF